MAGSMSLREMIESPSITIAPGVYDCISAMVVERAGFETGAISGSGISNSRMGKPDRGFLNLSENVAQSRAIADTVDIPVQADADTGYGNAVNVYETVRAFENAGVAAIMIEDQEWPKRCGHMDGTSIITAEEMAGKVDAAVEAREDSDLVIKARTDAYGLMGVDEAIHRGNLYSDHGADAIFVDRLLNEEDIRKVAAEIDAPVLINMGYGIKERPTTPLIPAKELESMGVAMVSYPRLITGAAVMGMQKALEALHRAVESDDVVTEPELTVGFEEYTDLLGLQKYDDLEMRFAAEDGS